MHRGVCFAICERAGQDTVLERCSKQRQCCAWMAPFHVFPWRRRELLRRRPQQLHGTRVLSPTPGASLNRAKGIHQPQHARWAEPVRLTTGLLCRGSPYLPPSVPRSSLPTTPRLQLVGAMGSSGLCALAGLGSYAHARTPHGSKLSRTNGVLGV